MRDWKFFDTGAPPPPPNIKGRSLLGKLAHSRSHMDTARLMLAQFLRRKLPWTSHLAQLAPTDNFHFERQNYCHREVQRAAHPSVLREMLVTCRHLDLKMSCNHRAAANSVRMKRTIFFWFYSAILLCNTRPSPSWSLSTGPTTFLALYLEKEAKTR